MGGSGRPPSPPDARRAPGDPERASMIGGDPGAPGARQAPPDARRAPGDPERASMIGGDPGAVAAAAPITITPMLRQYQDLKRQYPDVLLLFRLGDFYEMFFEDAERGARLLQIALTSRQGAPMAGIPHHAAETYIARLVRAGQKIAVCEQLEAPGKGKKLLRRDVVRVITPGTITDTAYLPGAANNFLLAVGPAPSGGRRRVLGVALLDVSTGHFWVGEDGGIEGAV